MKITLLMTMLCMASAVSAQTVIRLSLDNPSPRVGEKVELTFSDDFVSTELQKQLQNGISMNSPSLFGPPSSEFKKELVFTKPGVFTVGPFNMEFNGNKITTDSIRVEVLEKLPFEEGVWIRTVKDQNGKMYLIVEQYLEEDGKNPEGNSFPYDKSSTFVSVETDADSDVSFFSSGSKYLQKFENPDSYSGKNLTYYFNRYEIIFQNRHNGSFTLTKKHLKNLPDNVKFKKLKISP